MNTRRTTHTLTALTAGIAMSVTLAGCNASADLNPTQTIGRCTDCTPNPTATATSTTLDAAAKEKVDRAAAETVWRQFLTVVQTVEALPAADTDAATSAVAVDPVLSRIRSVNAQFRSEHKAGYGRAVSYITWPEPIDGKDTAILKDCTDGSQAGVLDTVTGNKLTVGTVNTPFQGTLRRTAQGWRVASSDLLQGATCTPGK